MSHRTFADVTVGETIDCGTTSVTREEILDFGRTYDPLAIHTDPEAAADSPFGGLIASGIHTFALTQPLVIQHFYGDSDFIVAGSIDELRLPAPVRPDDTLYVTLNVEDKRVSESNDRRGIITMRRLATVDSQPVFEMQNNTIWER